MNIDCLVNKERVEKLGKLKVVVQPEAINVVGPSRATCWEVNISELKVKNLDEIAITQGIEIIPEAVLMRENGMVEEVPVHNFFLSKSINEGKCKVSFRIMEKLKTVWNKTRPGELFPSEFQLRIVHPLFEETVTRTFRLVSRLPLEYKRKSKITRKDLKKEMD